MGRAVLPGLVINWQGLDSTHPPVLAGELAEIALRRHPGPITPLKLMSVTDVPEMSGIPIHVLYRWPPNGDGNFYRLGRHPRYLQGGHQGLAGAAGDKP